MTAKVYDNGDVVMYQGDDIYLRFFGVPTDDNYDAFIEIKDVETRKTIAPQVQTQTNFQDFVSFHLLGAYTKLMTVPDDAKYKNYSYAVKYCNEAKGIEQTFLIGGKDIGELNIIKVFPQGVEGI